MAFQDVKPPRHRAKPKVRRYQPSDYRACRDLWAQLTQRHRDIYGDPAIGGDDPGRGLDSYLANPARRITWVAEADGAVVGMAGLIVYGEEGEIEPVVVDSDFRSQGIGRALVAQAVRHGRKAGVRFLSVRPVARNVEALSFFVQAGFNIVGHIDLFQDLGQPGVRKWKAGILMHGQQLRY